MRGDGRDREIILSNKILNILDSLSHSALSSPASLASDPRETRIAWLGTQARTNERHCRTGRVRDYLISGVFVSYLSVSLDVWY